ncbi:hypothetical protein VISI1226_14178 [Vibrio sinaloensis DSM 21326]|uniref:Uncharacterized protein n=1 Tax=Vibrio sinaloensis DSM 21326 TaxID=945550 RepID=E8M424_PHOS4|nr:hypothetical protein VISI1226_14178 [Vibrio sinaloensis DSM 21326]
MAIPRDTKQSFVQKAKEKWGDKYCYESVIYLNSRTPVKITCNKHNVIFSQTPKAHFAAKRECCPLCYKEVAGTFQNQWRKSDAKQNGAIDFFRVNSLFNSLHT